MSSRNRWLAALDWWIPRLTWFVIGAISMAAWIVYKMTGSLW
jgi:hypothetical protein